MHNLREKKKPNVQNAKTWEIFAVTKMLSILYKRKKIQKWTSLKKKVFQILSQINSGVSLHLSNIKTRRNSFQFIIKQSKIKDAD